jgi:hypothetical protein
MLWKKGFSRHGWMELAAFASVMLAIGLPRVMALGRFVTPDEYLWLSRSANFYYAIMHGDFASTLQVGHPGVTAMWAGTAGFLARYPAYRDGHQGQLNPNKFDNYIKRKALTVSSLELLVAGRFFMVLTNILALAASYIYTRRLLGILPALIAFFLLAFNPFQIALARVLHLDGLSGNLMLLSVLAFLYYQRGQLFRHLIISATAAGLGWLTKSSALVLIPCIVALMFHDIWKYRPWHASLLWRYGRKALAWFLIGAFVFVVFWPSMWVNPIVTLNTVFAQAQDYAQNGHSTALFFNGQIIEDGNIGIDYLYFYPLTFLWRSTPVTCVGLVLAVIFILSRCQLFEKPEKRQTLISLGLFAVLFTLALTLPEKKFDRYLLAVYPPLDILAAAGWTSLTYYLIRGSKQSILRQSVFGLILFLVVGVQAGSALSTFPYYFTYYNPLMGGNRRAPEVMQIGWGEGLDQAGRYLSEKPWAGKLKVVSWYAPGCFSYYFEGQTRPFLESINLDENILWLEEADYAVVYISQWQRKLPENALEYLAKRQVEYSIWLDGLEYVRIYNLH